MGCKGLRGNGTASEPERLLDVTGGLDLVSPFSFLAPAPPLHPPATCAKVSGFGHVKGEPGRRAGDGAPLTPPPTPTPPPGWTPCAVADRRDFKEWARRVRHKGRVCEPSGIRPLMSLQLSSPN